MRLAREVLASHRVRLLASGPVLSSRGGCAILK